MSAKGEENNMYYNGSYATVIFRLNTIGGASQQEEGHTSTRYVLSLDASEYMYGYMYSYKCAQYVLSRNVSEYMYSYAYECEYKYSVWYFKKLLLCSLRPYIYDNPPYPPSYGGLLSTVHLYFQ